MPSTTITGTATIEYSDILKVAKQAVDNMFKQDETKAIITYRRYSLDTTNLVGDYNRQIYTDYSIEGIVLFLLLDDKVIQQGEFQPGDIELFIRPYINYEDDGTIISEPFEPQLDDEIIFQNTRFRIKLIRPEYVENTKVVLDCLCARVENDNPQVEWNDNYRAVDSDSRRGSGWD